MRATGRDDGPGAFDLSIYEGDSISWQFNLWSDDTKTTPVDLTGATAKAEIRDSPGGSTVIELVCVVTVPNEITVTLSATTSETAIDGVWDLQVTDAGGWVTTFVAGRVSVTADVTR